MTAFGYAEPSGEAIPAPLLIRSAGNAPLGALVLAIASLWLGTAVGGVLAGDPAIIPGLGSSGAYWAGAAGTALAVLALHWIVGRRTVVIAAGAVSVSERSLLGGRTWREPLASYPEIRVRVEQRPHRYGRRSWYVAQLWHPEPAKRVELVRARDPAALEARGRDFARRFGLRLVWEQPRSARADQFGVHAPDHAAPGGSPCAIGATAPCGRSPSAS